MTAVYSWDGRVVRAHEAPGGRPLRWAAWRPDGSEALISGNRGTVLSFDGARFRALETGTAHNLRGVGWAPDGSQALLVGNRGAVLLYDGQRFEELSAVTTENLRRVAWAPDGTSALTVGNGGCVLRFDAASARWDPLPGDRAHTMRSIAWRPDGAYALIGAYASAYAGYPRPHVLYRCDGRYTQAVLTTEDEDDTLAIDWRPAGDPPRARALLASYGDGGRVRNKIVEIEPGAVRYRGVADGAAMLGLAWRPDGDHALLCGESGALAIDDGSEPLQRIETGVKDTLVGPFWRPGGATPMALMLRGPDEKVYTI